jgi:hypothetical protein
VLLLAAVAGLQLHPGLAAAQEPASIGALARIQAPAQNYRFPDNVSYVYTAEWRLWTAGTATLKMERSGAQQRVTSTADATGVVALLFHVHDIFDSFFDSRTFCSGNITKHTEEGFRRKDTNIRFDYTRRKAVLDEKNLKANDSKHTEEDIPGCVTDVLSGIYYLGSLPLQVGSTYTFPVNDGSKTMEVRATVEGREAIKTDMGTFQTVRVQPVATSGPLNKKGSVWLWYSDDPAHIPVQVRVRAFWGTITVRLQRLDQPGGAATAASPSASTKQ